VLLADAAAQLVLRLDPARLRDLELEPRVEEAEGVAREEERVRGRLEDGAAVDLDVRVLDEPSSGGLDLGSGRRGSASYDFSWRFRSLGGGRARRALS
jgi:hypothetical protein